MKGYVQAPQFWYYARTLGALNAMPEGDAEVYSKLVGKPMFKVVPDRPAPMFGHVVFRVEDDDTLTQVDACYDSSG